MGLSITKEVIIKGLGPNITNAFHLDQLPGHRSLENVWHVIEIPGLDQICLHATNHSIHITPYTDLGATPSFNTIIDSGNKTLVSMSLYNENRSGIPVAPYKGMATEFFKRSIEYLSMVSPHGVITGMIARWKTEERNHIEFFKVYDPKKNNLVQAALGTYTGGIASSLLSFNKISRIPGFENRIPREDEELSLIFRK